jgi:hypothetical protein
MVWPKANTVGLHNFKDAKAKLPWSNIPGTGSDLSLEQVHSKKPKQPSTGLAGPYKTVAR